jgi:hypothetical protein
MWESKKEERERENLSLRVIYVWIRGQPKLKKGHEE